MAISRQKAALKLFGVYFIAVFVMAAFISSTTIRFSQKQVEEAQQAALFAQFQELMRPAPIALQHQDITGIKSLVNKRREHTEKRKKREEAHTTAAIASVMPAAALLRSSSQSTEYGDDNASKKFVAQDKDIPKIPVKYAATLDSVSRAQIRNQIVEMAKKHLGTRYVWAGKKPGGFDCSGFTAYMMSQFGISVSPSSRHQALQGEAKPLAQAEVGDLIFFSRYGKGGRISHVALVVNNGPAGIEVIHATSRGIVIDNINESSYWKPKILFAKDVISM